VVLKLDQSHRPLPLNKFFIRISQHKIIRIELHTASYFSSPSFRISAEGRGCNTEAVSGATSPWQGTKEPKRGGQGVGHWGGARQVAKLDSSRAGSQGLVKPGVEPKAGILNLDQP